MLGLETFSSWSSQSCLIYPFLSYHLHWAPFSCLSKLTLNKNLSQFLSNFLLFMTFCCTYSNSHYHVRFFVDFLFDLEIVDLASIKINQKIHSGEWNMEPFWICLQLRYQHWQNLSLLLDHKKRLRLCWRSYASSGQTSGRTACLVDQSDWWLLNQWTWTCGTAFGSDFHKCRA